MANLVVSYWGGYEVGNINMPIVYESKESLLALLKNKDNYRSSNHNDLNLSGYSFYLGSMFDPDSDDDDDFVGAVYTVEEWFEQNGQKYEKPSI